MLRMGRGEVSAFGAVMEQEHPEVIESGRADVVANARGCEG